MDHKIKINNVEYITNDDKVIVEISYVVTYSDKVNIIVPGDKYSYPPEPDKTVEVTEHVKYYKTLTLPPPSSNFTPFEDITKEILIGWVEEHGDLIKDESKAYKELHSKHSRIKYKRFL